MASKRSRRGQPGGPPRDSYFPFPWEEEDRRVRRELELARVARQQDEDRIRRFWEDQQRKREWINFAEIAEWYSELRGSANPKKATAARDRAYRMLEQDLLAGNFEESGRSQVLFTCPGVSLRKMTRRWLQDAIDKNLDGKHGRFYLKHCWLPPSLFERWCARHHLPKSPPRFQPTEGKHLKPSPDKGGQQQRAHGGSPKNKARSHPQGERAVRALNALYPSGIPDAGALPNKYLAMAVNEHLKKDNQPPIGQRTIQRAAGRK